jgi:hypothetical protein
LHLRTNGSERYFAACATTHIPQVQLDRVLFCELNHRADEMVAIEANTSDTLFTRIDRNAIEKDHSKITFRLILSYLRGHRTHRDRPPAPRFLLRRPPGPFLCCPIPLRGFIAPSPRRQPTSAKTITTALMSPQPTSWLSPQTHNQ